VAPKLEDAQYDPGIGGMGTGARSMGVVLEAEDSVLAKTAGPLVSCGTADVVAAAELDEGKVGAFGLEDETGAFIHDGLGPPGHRHLLARGPSLRSDL